MKKDDNKILAQLLSSKVSQKYIGKQVVICDGEVYILPQNDKKAQSFLNDLILKHPKSTPTITFVPKQGTYVLPLGNV